MTKTRLQNLMSFTSVESVVRIAFRPLLQIAGVVGVAAVLAGCGASTLETDDFNQPQAFKISDEATIEDSEENRAILETVNEYRQAMEARDVSRLKKLVASSYYENASSTDDASDDYGNERIDELFSDYLSETVQEIRYDMQIVSVDAEPDVAHVDYVYYWSFRYRQDGRDHWASDRDVNRLTLVQEQGSWKIAAGL